MPEAPFLPPLLTEGQLLKAAKTFHTKKHLGQNFLVAPAVLATITQTLELSQVDRVLEIGPGIGFLTRNLAATGATVTAVELDSEAIRSLQELRLPGCEIINDDFLRFDISKQIALLPTGDKLKVAGNVPYQITAKIIARLFGELDKPSPWWQALGTIVLTVQLEVARRFVAQPGESDYSQITLLTNFYSQPEIITVVPAGSFYPVPKVDSAVVRFTPRAVPAVAPGNARLFKQIIQAGFRQRRKMLRNNLSFLKLSAEQLSSVFKALNLDPQVRAERLSLAQLAAFTDACEQAMRKNSQEVGS
jgi:16S rRNA (adenine1518-N6/adenine1519-N6)-dimethyltransferase